jgi:hypothetical protein
MNQPTFALVASDTEEAETALRRLETRYATVPPERADVIVALGGDGLMLETLHASIPRGTPIYGMNRGTVGFLMNNFDEENLPERLARAERVTLHPLRMAARSLDGKETEALAINEVSLLRQSRQAAHIRIAIDGEVRMEELMARRCSRSPRSARSGRGAGAARCCPIRRGSPSRSSIRKNGRSVPPRTSPRCATWSGSRCARIPAFRCTCCSIPSTTCKNASSASSSCPNRKKKGSDPFF